jgi:hypothetical protein
VHCYDLGEALLFLAEPAHDSWQGRVLDEAVSHFEILLSGHLASALQIALAGHSLMENQYLYYSLWQAMNLHWNHMRRRSYPYQEQVKDAV